MRIWHDRLTPNLCYIHASRSYREGLTILDIVTCDKVMVDGKSYRAVCNSCLATNSGQKTCLICGKRLDGYFNHPAVKEWWDNPFSLWCKLLTLQEQAMKRLDIEKQQEPKRKFSLTPIMPVLIYSHDITGIASNFIPDAISIKYDKTIIQPWQTYEQQLEVLRHKRATQTNCRCEVG